MKRWFKNLPIKYQLLIYCACVFPLIIIMIAVDVSLTMQESAVISQLAHVTSEQAMQRGVAQLASISRMLLISNCLFGGLAMLGACICAIVIARTMTRLLLQVQEAAHKASINLIELADGLVALAQGDWSVPIAPKSIPLFYEAQDEIGQMAESVHTITSTIQRMCNIYELTRQELQGLYIRIQEQNDILSMANNHLNALATTDPLTGLPNHRDIMYHIDMELANCQISQRNCAIIFVDVDHFKRVNDTWGHAAGDAVLCFVGQQLSTWLRNDDFVGRYGGEEFAILLTDIEQLEAIELAERLRTAIAEQPYYWEIEETGTTVPIAVTASFGIAIYPLDGITRKELIEMADAAMYTAKHNGRDQVCLPDDNVFAQQHTNMSEIIQQQTERGIVQALATVEKLHDQETHDHALRMLSLAEATTRALSRSDEEIQLIRMAAQMHDIGKVGIPDAILHKAGPLNEQEWSVMRHHPHMSQQILAQVGGRFELVSHIVVAHHERWDGEGYPYGLAGKEIPLGARILSVVDSYDAMTSSRPYRKALPDEQAREELVRCKGSQYDPEVVDAFLYVLQQSEKTSKLGQTVPTKELLPGRATTAAVVDQIPSHTTV